MFQSSLADSLGAVPFRPLTVVLALLVVGVAVRRLVGRPLTAPLRRRLLLGVPWGTLLTAGGVLSVYLFLQGAYWHSEPLVTPFRSWSYGYPLGVLTAAFTHAGPNHVTGNLMGAVVYGTVLEYAWSHYPTGRGATSFGSWRTNPFARIFAVPAVAIVVGLFGSIFAIGPVIGFSGVVFAMAGVAMVTRPTLFLGGLLTTRFLTLLFNTFLSPEPTVGGSVRFVTPWWANIAIQGHAVGLLTGVLLSAAVLRTRQWRPTPGRVFFATLIFAVSNGLWAVYVPLGDGQYTLFRWVGTSLILVLALLVAAAILGPDEGLVPDFDGGWPSLSGFALIVVFAALCLAALPTGFAAIDAADTPENGIEVRDYVVTYDEDVPNAYARSVPVVDRTNRSFNQSGVIVVSPDRDIWTTTVSDSRLALSGDATVVVGGVGWRETVTVNRTGWAVSGNDTVYRVTLLRAANGTNESTTAYTSGPATAEDTIDGRNLTFRADDGFEVDVRRDGATIDSGPVPANTTSERIGGLTLRRNDSTLYASRNGTRVSVAQARP